MSCYRENDYECYTQRGGETRGAAQQPTRAGPSNAAAGVRYPQLAQPLEPTSTTATTATPADGFWAPRVVGADRLMQIAARTAPPPSIEDREVSDEEPADKTSAVCKPAESRSRLPLPPPRGDIIYEYISVEDDEDEDENEEPADKRRNVRTLSESHPRLGITPCVEDVSDEEPAEKTCTDRMFAEWKSMISSSSKSGILHYGWMELLDEQSKQLNMSTMNLILLLLSEERRRSRLPAEDSSQTSSYPTTNKAFVTPRATHESIQPMPQLPSGGPLSQRQPNLQPMSQAPSGGPLSQRQPNLQPMPRAPSGGPFSQPKQQSPHAPLPVRRVGCEDLVRLLGMAPIEVASLIEQESRPHASGTLAKPKPSSEGHVGMTTRQKQRHQEHGRTGELPDGEHFNVNLELLPQAEQEPAIAAPQGPLSLGPSRTHEGQTTVGTSGHGGPRMHRAGEQPAANGRCGMKRPKHKHHSDGWHHQHQEHSSGPRPQLLQQTNGQRPHSLVAQRPPIPRPGTEAGASRYQFRTPPAVAPSRGSGAARDVNFNLRHSK